MGPLYPQMLARRFGMAAAVNAVIAAAGDRHNPELPAAAEDLAHEVTLFGTYEQAEATIAAWFAAGADDVNLVLPPNRPEQELAEILKVAARVVSTHPSSRVRPDGASAGADQSAGADFLIRTGWTYRQLPTRAACHRSLAPTA